MQSTAMGIGAGGPLAAEESQRIALDPWEDRPPAIMPPHFLLETSHQDGDSSKCRTGYARGGHFRHVTPDSKKHAVAARQSG
jgi:hypothetical protein